jgi:hypothetical protein
MAPSFDNTPETWQRPDWRLLQNGFITLLMSSELFKGAKHQLNELGYLLVELDAGTWETSEAALVAFGKAFDFPDYYGKNLDALVDCLRDVAAFDYGSDPNSDGTVVAIDHLDVLAHKDSEFAWQLLDILADTGRRALLIGHRFIVIGRSDNPRLEFRPVGATGVLWNEKEWLNKRRGI